VRPMWRQAFDKVEGAAAPLLEQATRSDRFVDLMAAGARARKLVAMETEKASRRWLHLWNLPAAGDMAALRRQLAGLEREVRQLRRQVAAVDSSPEGGR
jgi:hypothetical protein